VVSCSGSIVGDKRAPHRRLPQPTGAKPEIRHPFPARPARIPASWPLRTPFQAA
jgi:hypothetical protein